MGIVSEFAANLKTYAPSPGASWIKADFHLHTPESFDQKYGECDYDTIAKRLAEQGFHLVVVTDHNTLAGYKALKKAAALYGVLVLPGAEFSVKALAVEDKSQKLGNRYIHLLTIFDPELPDLEFALKTILSGGDATAGVLTLPAKDAAIEGRYVEQLVAQLKKIGALVIPAHLHSNHKDPANSRSMDDVFTDEVFLQWVRTGLFDALEVIDTRTAAFFDGQHKETGFLSIACVRSSDAHCLDDLGRRGTWLKMEELSFRNLKRALLDHQARVTLGDPGEPKYHRVIGACIQGKFLKEVWFPFNDGLNCFIGPKGVGKSTAIECIRWALELPVPDIPGLAKGKQRFQIRVQDMLSEVLGPNASVKVLVQSEAGSQYLVVRERSRGQNPPPVVYQEDDTQTTLPFHPDVFALDFYGWEEIGNAAENTAIQRDIVDRHCGSIVIDGETLDISEGKSRIRKSQARLDELVDLAVQTRKDIEDVKRKMTELESLRVWLKSNASQQGVLVELETVTKAISQLSATSTSIGELLVAPFVVGFALKEGVVPLATLEARTEEAKGRLEAAPLTGGGEEFRGAAITALTQLVIAYRNAVLVTGVELESEVLEAKDLALGAVTQVIHVLEGSKQALVTEAEGIEGTGVQEKLAKLKRQQERYDALMHELQGNPLEKLGGQQQSLQEEYSRICMQLQYMRHLISLARQQTAAELTTAYPDIRVEVFPRARWDEFAELLEDTFKGSYLDKGWYKRLSDKEAYPERIADALFRSDQESLCRLGLSETSASNAINWVWDKPDRLKTVNSAEVDDEPCVSLLIDRERPEVSESYRRADKLSSGQRSTALFPLITHGSRNPLVIDQPEDDLDNSYVYSYLVSQVLRPSKGRRQFVFVTHNANIPVLGDAENIIVMEGQRGEGRVARNGYIDNREVVSDVTRVLEGSTEAFSKRREKYGLTPE